LVTTFARLMNLIHNFHRDCNSDWQQCTSVADEREH
jgi:hypothetical protein